MSSIRQQSTRWMSAVGAVSAMLLVASCASGPAAMNSPKTDPLTNRIVVSVPGSPGTPSGEDPPGGSETMSFYVGTPMHVEVTQTVDSGMLYISGDVDPEGAVPQASLKVGFAKGEVDMEWILVGGNLYGKANPGGWTDLGPVSGYLGGVEGESSTLRSMYGLVALLAIGEPAVAMFNGDAANVKASDPEKVGGIDADVVTLNVGTTEAKAWLGEDGNFLQITTADQDDGTSVEWVFSSLGKPISVTAPQ